MWSTAYYDKESEGVIMRECPFCGEKIHGDMSVHKLGRIDYVYSIKCEKCSASGPERFTQEGAIESWNKRA